MQNKKALHFTKFYLRIIAVTTLGLGIGLLLLPAWVGSLFFDNLGTDINFFARMVGSTLIGYATLNALAAKNGSQDVCKVAVWSNLVTLLIASVVTLSYINAFDGFGLLVIGQHIVFALGFAYCAWQLAKTK